MKFLRFMYDFSESTDLLLLLLLLFPKIFPSAGASAVSRQCAGIIDCFENYEICLDGVCTSATESSGLEPWVIGTIAISALLTVRLK